MGFGGGECEVESEIEKNGESMGDMGRDVEYGRHGGDMGDMRGVEDMVEMGGLWDIGNIGEMEEMGIEIEMGTYG